MNPFNNNALLVAAQTEPRRPQAPGGTTGLADICQWCFNPFRFTMQKSGLPRSSVEYESLRRSLKIGDPYFLPVICDGCFESVTGSAMTDDKVARIGGNNAGYDNNTLRLISGAGPAQRSALAI